MDLAYYGDDFTGSTDVLEALASAGLAAELCVSTNATASLIASGRSPSAIGLAGMSRTFPPAAMDTDLLPALQVLASARPRFLHYKVCSTFDSSPHIGSIGRAIELGRQSAPARHTPVLAAAPHLGRWSAFGTLFARSGLDSPVYRLDRHPTMSRHPVTPMDEADLRLVLARQTSLPTTLIDLPTLDRGVEAVLASIERAPDGVVLFDATSTAHLATIGATLDRLQRQNDETLFVVGSSGIEASLVAAGALGSSDAASPPATLPASPLLAIVGSRSPVTARQVEVAGRHGFVEVTITPRTTDAELTTILACATTAHQMGPGLLLRPGDGDFAALAGTDLGRLLGRIAGMILDAVPFRRIVVAGGDTSGEVARHLGIDSLRFEAPLAPGAPWCRVTSARPTIAGAVFAFKGGQVGRDDFFVVAADAPAPEERS